MGALERLSLRTPLPGLGGQVVACIEAFFWRTESGRRLEDRRAEGETCDANRDRRKLLGII